MTNKTSTTQSKISRRGALQGLAGGAAFSALLSVPAKAAVQSVAPNLRGQVVYGANPVARAAEAFSRTVASARRRLSADLPTQQTNNDEHTYRANFAASFTKTLPHDSVGIVDRDAYRKLLFALRDGRPSMFDRVPLDNTVRTRKLANPLGAYSYASTGIDTHANRMPAASGFTSLETAGEMVELYWKAHLRDVPFARYQDVSLVDRALSDVNAFPFVAGAPNSGQHTIDTIFRGETEGDRTGPYITQFLLRDIPYGPTTVAQRYATPARGADFMSDTPEWLTVQRGGVVGETVKAGQRYIHNGRSLAEFVHADFSFQSYLNAGLILLSWGPDFLDGSFSSANSATMGNFVSLGGPEVLDLITRVGHIALRAAWYQKWLVHRRLRPEVYAGRYHFQELGSEDYGLPQALKDTLAVRKMQRQNGTLLLPQCYPEGSPTHPSYPAGHACIAGACVTILKAFFNEAAEVPNPVDADAGGRALLPYAGRLTVGGELNKLANNISLGRDWAGVHYRADGIEGIKVGEALAIDLLVEHSQTYREHFKGYELTRFDGTRIKIRDGSVR